MLDVIRRALAADNGVSVAWPCSTEQTAPNVRVMRAAVDPAIQASREVDDHLSWSAAWAAVR